MIIQKLLLAFIGLLLIASYASAQGYLKAEGKFIVNEQGEKVVLKGMGLGGWMLQEGYMLKLPKLAQQYNIRNQFQDLIGKEATEEFYKAWLENHTTKADIDAMARWGFNSVRLPMHYNLYTLPVEQEPEKGKNTWLKTGFEMTDELLAWCKANNMYLILDLHAAPGGQGNDHAISDRDPTKPSLWDSKENQEKMIALWRELAKRYADEPMIGGYDIINEPNWAFEGDNPNGCAENNNKPLKDLMVRVTKAIREVDSKHMIIIEGNCWGNNYKGVLPTWDDNMVISFHKYWNTNKQEDIAEFIALRDKYNAPIWLGESGENSNLWFKDAIQLAEANGIGWAFWPLKKIGFNNPLQIHPNEGYWSVVDYLNNNGPRPSREKATEALLTFAKKDIRYENNKQNMDVVDAMLRQPHTNVSKPFKDTLITETGGRILAVDYDLGVNGYADKDSANYHVSTKGERTPWNRGLIYRNDGVDISVSTVAELETPYYIDNIVSNEWLDYTFTVKKAGVYKLFVVYSNEGDEASITISVNNDTLVNSSSLPKELSWKTQYLTKTTLLEGTNHLKLKAIVGGYKISSIHFEPENRL